MLKEFRNFLMRGNLIELAVAFVMAAAFGAVVTSLVTDIIMQIVGAIFGKPDFSTLTFDLGDGVIKYGSFLNAVVNFVLVGAAVFFLIVKPVNMLTARFAKEKPADAPPPAEEILLLREIRDALKSR